MIISFDIDNTLIPYADEFEVERQTLLARLLGAEKIRKGSIELFHELENKGHQIWIYTTSFRTKFSLWKTFISYGLNPRKIINGQTSQRQLSKHNCKASKHPKLFGIDIHVDDSEGVKREGERYGFQVIFVDPSDQDWQNTVLFPFR